MLAQQIIKAQQGRYIAERSRFESFPCDIMPEGYISSEEFRKRAIEKVDKFCNKYGIL